MVYEILTKSRTVLITGVAGFIGSHCCQKLLEKPDTHNIVGIDNLSSYYSLNLKRANLNLFKDAKNFSFHTIDITDKESLKNLFKNIDFDSILHLAAQAGVRYSLKNPSDYVSVNIGGTLNILEMARKFGVESIIFGSTSSIYGNSPLIPFSEETPIPSPISLYSATKLSAEILLETYYNLYGIPVNCLRFFTVYGPRGRPDMAPHIFFTRILNDQPIQVFDHPEGKIKRDFTYITDMVKGILAALDYKNGFEVFNLGFGKPIGLIDFIRVIEKLTKKEANIQYLGPQAGDVVITHADCTKAKEKLGFLPEIDLEEGLKRYYQWYQEFYAMS